MNKNKKSPLARGFSINRALKHYQAKSFNVTFLMRTIDIMSVWHRRQGSSDNLLEFLTRQTDKDLIVDLVKGMKAIKS